MDSFSDKFLEYWHYKVFVEELITLKHKRQYLNSICEIAELEFLARLPRITSRKEIESYLNKITIKFDIVCDVNYLKKRWIKLFKEKIYKSTADARLDILKRDKNKCQYCERTRNLEVHHVIPKDSKKCNGSDSYYNLVLACGGCNKVISNDIVLPRNWWLLHSESRHSF